MNSRELVRKTILDKNPKYTPVYGWVRENLSREITEAFGSVENFEDHYKFDLAHIFGGPSPFNKEEIDRVKSQGIELTPEVYLDIPLMSLDNMDDYKGVMADLNHHQEERERFCYIQTPGIFECLNDVFGIENNLYYMALYPEELGLVYERQSKWNKEFADRMMDLGFDMIHVSDDWGAQNSLMFSNDMWKSFVYKNHKPLCDRVKERGCFLSLHSDGNINSVLDGVVDLGYDVIHPWQESAGMSYDVFLDKYKDKLTILGGLCIQTTLGFGDYDRLESEIRRVFSLLKNKSWLFCTTHYVQDHCTIEELIFAFDLVTSLARQ